MWMMLMIACGGQPDTPDNVAKLQKEHERVKVKGKKKKKKGKGKRKGRKARVVRDSTPLDGHWLVNTGKPEAWKVSGEELTVFDGTEERELSLQLLSPCRVMVKEGSVASYWKLTFDKSDLYLGLGNAGVVKGDRVTACISNARYMLADGKCRKQVGTHEPEEVVCTYAEGVFEAGGVALKPQGRALMDAQMKANKATAFGSWEDAKDAVKKARK